MIAMVTVFFMFIVVSALIGTVRGWAKEMLVIFSVVLALALISLVEDLLGLGNSLFKNNPSLQYWFRMITVGVLVFFGYQSPSLPRLQRAAEKRSRISDNLLGLFIGAISGYFVYGTLWAFSSQAQYPFLQPYIRPVPPELAEITDRVMNLLPPIWMDKPLEIFIFVVIAFIFVIIYFL
jgi:uncharacterized membrane protein YfcA